MTVNSIVQKFQVECIHVHTLSFPLNWFDQNPYILKIHLISRDALLPPIVPPLCYDSKGNFR